MVMRMRDINSPLELVVTGEVEGWLPTLQKIVGPQWLHTRRVRSDHELLEVVRTGQVDAAVLDDECPWDLDVLRMLRMIRQVNSKMQVVVVTKHTERQWMETALRLAAFSVVSKPLKFEPLIKQIHGIMKKLHMELKSPQSTIIKLEQSHTNDG